MFCPNCGAKLTQSDQTFCASCGLDFTSIKSQLTPERSEISDRKQMPVRMGAPGSHSMRCLGFGIASIALAVFNLSYGLFILIFSLFFFDFNRMIVELIIISIIHIVGVIFGIVSRVNGQKARNLDPENAAEKVGSLLGLGGIIINAGSLVLAPIIYPLLGMFDYSSLPPFTYTYD